MDELGNHLAGETTDATPTGVSSSASELRKRRSTRIVQAVPLQVTGVDALGRPFVERTSSLILNCHGCRYQSKHYVLKNMWVRLEIPHPEENHEPRMVRGRVAWIQRPRTVRQLFQVALELEVPGNVWGIGFPPEDWFNFSENDKSHAEIAGPAFGSLHGAPPMHERSLEGAHERAHELVHDMAPTEAHGFSPETEFHVSLNEAGEHSAPANPTQGPSPTGGGSADKVRVFPSPNSATDASLQLARQLTRLLADARQQIQTAAREAAAQAVNAERLTSEEQWDKKLAEAREELAGSLSSAIAKIQEESAGSGRTAEATTAALRDDVLRAIAPQLEEMARSASAKVQEEGAGQRDEHLQGVDARMEMLRSTAQQVEEAVGSLREIVDGSIAQISARAEEAQRALDGAQRAHEQQMNAQRDALNAANTEMQERASATLGGAQSNWQAFLNGEAEAAQTRWQIAVDNALLGAQDRASHTVNEHGNQLFAKLQEEAERLANSLRETAGGIATQSEQHIVGLRNSLEGQAHHMEGLLGQAGEASERLTGFTARLDTVQQQALERFQGQVDDVLSLHRNELHRRSDALFGEISGRIRAAFDDSSREAAAIFSQQIDAVIQPQIAKSDEAMQRLAGGRSLLDAAMSLQQDRVREATDAAFADALETFRTEIAGAEKSLQVAADTMTTKTLTEVEGRLEALKQQTAEDVVKSAEWYEKRAQTQIQLISEQVSEQTAAHLHEKAGQISNEFAMELDQSSKNFVSYAQGQMAEVVSDAFERARSLFSEAAETTSAAFVDEIQRHARQDLEGFTSELQDTTAQARMQVESAHAELKQKLTVEQEDFLRRFHSAMHGAVDQGVASAHEKVHAGFEPLLAAWNTAKDTHQAEMHAVSSKISEEAAHQYRERLENVSNQWMLATVSSLDHQSRDAVSRLASVADEKLRETCSQVFADIGESLRERLHQIAATLSGPGAKTS
jgi:hypothetical protein